MLSSLGLAHMNPVQALSFTGLKTVNSNGKLMAFSLPTSTSITPLATYITALFTIWRCVPHLFLPSSHYFFSLYSNWVTPTSSHCNYIQFDTKYYYEVGIGNTTRQFWFKTPPPVGPNVPYTFGLIGD